MSHLASNFWLGSWWRPSWFNYKPRLLRLHSWWPSMEVPTTSSCWSKTSSTFKSHPQLRNATFCQNNCSILALPGQSVYALHILAFGVKAWYLNLEFVDLVVETSMLRLFSHQSVSLFWLYIINFWYSECGLRCKIHYLCLICTSLAHNVHNICARCRLWF